ncbi:hypothetical protein FRX31_022425 [Thalictrum thalictroides]|uniref:Uncharacterized protein n=1 Tax=Thalictrum thalictroides TaxID=46969 RepID=A0A7J6VUY7_THATH|nr:hypothetical protein FRX31_022425 [Thalictrum thalictroides]
MTSEFRDHQFFSGCKNGKWRSMPLMHIAYGLAEEHQQGKKTSSSSGSVGVRPSPFTTEY